MTAMSKHITPTNRWSCYGISFIHHLSQDDAPLHNKTSPCLSFLAFKSLLGNCCYPPSDWPRYQTLACAPVFLIHILFVNGSFRNWFVNAKTCFQRNTNNVLGGKARHQLNTEIITSQEPIICAGSFSLRCARSCVNSWKSCWKGSSLSNVPDSIRIELLY